MFFKSLSQFLIFWGWRGEIIQAKLWSGTEKQKVRPCLVLFPLSRGVGHDFCTNLLCLSSKIQTSCSLHFGVSRSSQIMATRTGWGGAVSRIKKKLSF